MGARLYDPVLGRFVQADSMFPGGTDLQQFNRYTYVSNNPLVYTDPTGHWGAQQQGYLRTAAAIAISVYTAGAVAPIAAGGSGVFLGMKVTANAGMVVMAGGFCGFMLGTTANAMANMGALVERYGPAPKAYLVVPLVGAFFIDFANALLITFFLNLWG